MNQFAMGTGGLVLVLIALAWRSGIPQKLLERLKNRTPAQQFRSAAEATGSVEQHFPELPVLQGLLERHKKEQQRLDEEKELLRTFLYEQTEPKETK